MPTPTEVVTSNAQEFLGNQYDVVLAIRVEWGAGATRVTMSQAAAQWSSVLTPIFLPVLAWNRARATKRRLLADPNAGCGILALTSDDGRFLLSAMPSRRKTPTGVIERFPEGAALLPDVDLMETNLVPSLTVGTYELVVNGVDFRALLNAVETGTVKSPKLEAALKQLRAVGSARYL